MRVPRNAPAEKPFWWYPLWALPLPELLLVVVFWLQHQSQVAAYPDSWTVGPATGDFALWLWLQCSLGALFIALIAPVFPVNRYLPEIILLGYTLFALLVGVYFTFWGIGVEIGLGLIAYSGRATLIAGLSLLLRRLLLQWYLGWRQRATGR